MNLFKIILFQVLPASQIGMHHFDEKFFFSCFVLASFLFVAFLLGRFAKATQPRGREGWLSCGEHTDCAPVWCPSAEQSPVLGTVGPRDKFCPRKNGTPQSGSLEIHARVEQVVLFQDDRKHRQEFRQSSFPFSGRTYTSSPSEYKRFPPTGEKPQDPWGPS